MTDPVADSPGADEAFIRLVSRHHGRRSLVPEKLFAESLPISPIVTYCDVSFRYGFARWASEAGQKSSQIGAMN
jgi:hypothetical protein